MSIQILSLRQYLSASGIMKMTDSTHYKEMWRATNISDLFQNMEEYVGKIPEEERYNMFYTVSECEESKRIFLRQTVIPFDLDGIDTTKIDLYINLFCSFLNVERDKIAIVMTGHGLQFLVGVTREIENGSYFDINKIFYVTMCRKLDEIFKSNGLQGSMDTTCFSVARLFRLPLTKNDKSYKGLPPVDALLINRTIDLYDLDLHKLSGIPEIPQEDQMHHTVYDSLPYVDTAGVQAGCDFLKYCLSNQEKVTEPQWYAMLSIVARLHDGRTLAHQYSAKHTNYDPLETDNKIDQALSASGPRTCLGISNLFSGCTLCPNWQKVNSPITLRGTEFLATQNDGFWIVERKRGTDERKYIRPCYEDLVKYFKQLHPFKSLTAGGIIWTYENGFWRDWARIDIHSFLERNLVPPPNNSICKEFEGKLLRNCPVDDDFFNVIGKINLNNGILDYETNTLLPHSPEFGFTYKLPFDYDPTARCPRFDSFLSEIFDGNAGMCDLMLEFMGYSLSGVPCEVGQKAVILFGDGSNGKSVLLDTLCYLAGDTNYSALSMGAEINKMENRYQLAGKLFNVSEETPTNSMIDSSTFKVLVTGGKVQVRKYYHDAYNIKNRCKILMACNELPDTIDNTVGMYRRLIIIPFNVEFSKEKGNMDIHLRQKLYEEASGIFNRCLEGLNRFLKQGHFTEVSLSEDSLENYKADSDVHTQWLKDNLIPSNGSVLSNKQLHQQYAFEMDQLRIKPINNVHLMRKARKILPNQAFKNSAGNKWLQDYMLRTGDTNGENY